MKLKKLYPILFYLFTSGVNAQVQLSSTNLPIVKINTEGRTIGDNQIMSKMQIIHNERTGINAPSDPPNVYNGNIGINHRGSTSRSFPKKPFKIEIKNNLGEDDEAALLGMPKEEDWVLNASYNDKTLIRDGLTYILAGKFMEFAPKVRYVELMINDQYEGVYLLTENIKRGKSRVAVKKMESTDISGDNVTGGYIIKLDKTTGSNSGKGWFSRYKPFPGATQNVFFQYEYPKANNILPPQEKYIQEFMHAFEGALISPEYTDPEVGYRKYIDPKTFIDFIIVNELSKNPDGYRLSTFMYKDRNSVNGKLKMGPVWDFNLGLGNVDYCTQGDPRGLVYKDFNKVCPGDGWVVHYWWERLMSDPKFSDELKKRWHQLRSSHLSLDNIYDNIDSLTTYINEAQKRNFQKWPILNTYVWPNYFVGRNYDIEIDWLKSWLRDRLDFLDSEWKYNSANEEVVEQQIRLLSSNPTFGNIIMEIPESFDRDISINIFNNIGTHMANPESRIENNQIEINFGDYAPGFYVIELSSNFKKETFKIIKI